jgi:outer membrane protein TolC
MLPNWLNRLILLFVFINSGQKFVQSQSQILTIDDAIEAAIKKNPANKQYNLIDESTNMQIEAIKKQNLPIVSWNSQISVQSENINLKFPIPNVDPISLPLYKAQSNLESNYLFYDGGISKELIENEKLKQEIGKQNITTQLYNIKNQVADIYYSIILIDRQKEILDSSLSFLNIRRKTLVSMVSNGVILGSDLDKMDMEIIKLEQNISSVKSRKKMLSSVLTNLTGIDIDKVILEPKTEIKIVNQYWGKRPEITLFSLKKDLLDANTNILDLKNKPKIVFFGKAGIGYPNPFNFFDENISPFAIGGINLIWNIWDWKRTIIDKQKIKIEKDIVDNQKSIFDENMKLETDRLLAEISGLEQNASFDRKIIENQNKIIAVTENQYKNGIATINIYLEEINKKNIAELNAVIHETELIKAKFRLKTLYNE